jgi:hypothetical protein
MVLPLVLAPHPARYNDNDKDSNHFIHSQWQVVLCAHDVSLVPSVASVNKE